MSAEWFGAALADQMEGSMSIGQKIRAFYAGIAEDEHHRYRSWEHCYCFFQRIGRQGIIAQRDEAAIQLGFYLASWGMYRGSSYLLQQAYTVHRGVVDCLGLERFAPLWEREFGTATADEDATLVNLVLEAAEAVKKAYESFQATDTLTTKVLLGTLGCLPACDLYFRRGLKKEGLKFSKLNKPFVDRILAFCRENKDDLRTEQDLIKTVRGVHYPLMKLVDMYFWQFGRPSSEGHPAQ
jgi:hypothetical protein